mmetsp:Transcript_27705/g.59209  ORF Transcript_27705/g.59209 Transcript_27705/m.59209 type:complete len:267 (-) Transcript_27705:404-1204(-)
MVSYREQQYRNASGERNRNLSLVLWLVVGIMVLMLLILLHVLCCVVCVQYMLSCWRKEKRLHLCIYIEIHTGSCKDVATTHSSLPSPLLSFSSIRSITSQISRSSGSIEFEPIASMTSSKDLPSVPNIIRVVLGRPIPPARSCQVGCSIVTWQAVQARRTSPTRMPAASPFPPSAIASIVVSRCAGGTSSSCPKTTPSGRGAWKARMREDAGAGVSASSLPEGGLRRGAKSHRSISTDPSPLRMGTTAEYRNRRSSLWRRRSSASC